MSADHKTVAVYDAKSNDYALKVAAQKDDPILLKFMKRLEPGAIVLDFGCGPGIQAATMQDGGFRVEASDASASMVELARKNTGIDVQKSQFSDLCKGSAYDAVWANFSLLHVRRTELPRLIFSVFLSLKAGGIFHLGMKVGEGENRDHLGRFYTYYSAEELRTILHASGFKMLEEFVGRDEGLAGTVDPWIVIHAQRSY